MLGLPAERERQSSFVKNNQGVVLSPGAQLHVSGNGLESKQIVNLTELAFATRDQHTLATTAQRLFGNSLYDVARGDIVVPDGEGTVGDRLADHLMARIDAQIPETHRQLVADRKEDDARFLEIKAFIDSSYPELSTAINGIIGARISHQLSEVVEETPPHRTWLQEKLATPMGQRVLRVVTGGIKLRRVA